MHVYDIEEALDDADARSLQHAFHILINFPHHGHIEGARSHIKLDKLFEHVTSAVQHDHATMPDRICQAIERVTTVPIALSTPYAHGAIIASEYRAKWRSLFINELSRLHHG